jgi:4a-hydroxytetrahydrobiopterin dehydratase
LPSALTESEVRRRLGALPGWERDGVAIRRSYRFETYMAGVRFATRVAELAEQADHHPDILIGYRQVTLTLTSHDAGGLTDRDFDLAARIDAS